MENNINTILIVIILLMAIGCVPQQQDSYISQSYDRKRKEIFKPEFLFDHFPKKMIITPTKSATSGYSIFDTEKPYSFFYAVVYGDNELPERLMVNAIKTIGLQDSSAYFVLSDFPSKKIEMLLKNKIPIPLLEDLFPENDIIEILSLDRNDSIFENLKNDCKIYIIDSQNKYRYTTNKFKSLPYGHSFGYTRGLVVMGNGKVIVYWTMIY